MEYRLNKIDTDVRNTINNQTIEGIVHSKHNIELNSQMLKEKRFRDKNFQKKKNKEPFSISKYNKSGVKIEVKAYKVQNVELSAEKEERVDSDLIKGQFIDSKR